MKKRLQPKFLLGPAASLLLAVLLSGCTTLLCLWIQPNSLRAVLAVFRAQPLLIVLNCLPIGLLILAVSFLLRNIFSSTALVGFCCALLSLGNRIKLEVRDEPVFPRDLALLKEVGSAMNHYDIHWPLSVFAAISLFLLLMGIGALLVGCRPLTEKKGRSLLIRLGGSLASLAVLAVLTVTLYASNNLYNSFRVSNAYYVPSVFNELGFPYCFTHHFTTYTVDKPEGYSRAEAASWDTGGSAGQGAPVHVIMVMNEAFSNLTDEDVFTYSDEDDPLANFHALQKNPHCISGHVVVPGFAGGTANTEFDVLTGMQTNALSATTTSALRVVNRNLDSVLRTFGQDGYHTSFFHPGDNWFYNRENVYRWLGAQESIFAAQMPDLQYKGRWVTDDYLAAFIETKFEEAIEKDQLLFNYTTTIQNHMSYPADKYGPDYVFPAVQTSARLSPEVETMLSVYIEGVRDADAMLGRLVEYFSQREEPVILAFWGDHLPYLGDGQLAYKELGLDIAAAQEDRTDPFSPYETPYIIWANDAAAEAVNWEQASSALQLPEDGMISACYLGGLLLELTGRGSESPWFSFLSEARRELPVIQNLSCQTAEGLNCTIADLPEEQQALIQKLRQWSYYKLKHKEVN